MYNIRDESAPLHVNNTIVCYSTFSNFTIFIELLGWLWLVFVYYYNILENNDLFLISHAFNQPKQNWYDRHPIYYYDWMMLDSL